MAIFPEKSLLISMPYGLEKKRLLQGNWDLAAYLTYKWYGDRADYIALRRKFTGQDPQQERNEAYYGELDELAKIRQQKLVHIKESRNFALEWQNDPIAADIWELASEHADVHIVAASILREQGWVLAEVADLWRGRKITRVLDEWLQSYVRFISLSRNELEGLGVDLAEAIMAKLEQNDLHYESKLDPILHVFPLKPDGKTWSRHTRANVGNPNSSQIPSMVMWSLGESVLASVHKSPFGSNGHKPRALMIEDGAVRVASSDKNDSYGLYFLGYVNNLADIPG